MPKEITVRVACVLVPNLYVQLARIDDATLSGHPIIIGGLPLENKPVLDVSDEAIRAGVRLGMSLRQAFSLCSEAIFLPANDRGCGEAFSKVIAILEDFSPAVDTEQFGCAYLDVSGVFNERKPGRDIVTRILSETSLKAGVGISSGKFFAWLAGLSSRADPVGVVPPGQEREFISPLAIELLPCSGEIKERLCFLGIRTIGQLTRFSRGELATQFGSDGSRIYELANGLDLTPLVVRRKEEAVTESLELDSPVESAIEILKVCQVTLAEILSGPQAHGKACREIILEFRSDAGSRRGKKLSFKEATSSPADVLNRVRNWLESTTLPSPVVELKLTLVLTAETGRKLPLWRGQVTRNRDLGSLAHELKTRFGYQPLQRFESTEPYAVLPEHRFRLVDIADQ